MASTYPIESDAVRRLSKLIEESTRATTESVKYFVEPTPGVLDKAKNKRHHIIFGRRGSGKSSLLHKVAADLTVGRTPIAYIDLEQFKGHSYPDVLISVLVNTFTEFRKWLNSAATNPASKTSFWKTLFGSVPTKGAFPRKETLELSEQFGKMLAELNDLLFQADEQKTKQSKTADGSTEAKLTSKIELNALPIHARVEGGLTSKLGEFTELQSEYTSKKIEALHRNILRYKQLFEHLAVLAGGPSFLLLDDLYHLRVSDQPLIIDYFFRIAKGANLWLKIGTIRHRSRWYVRGNPSIGMKLGDDADEIDLDATLEKYGLTKNFLFRILSQLSSVAGVQLDEILVEGGRDRLVLASGGVARDFLSIFRKSIDVILEKMICKDFARGTKSASRRLTLLLGNSANSRKKIFLETLVKMIKCDLLALLKESLSFAFRR